MRISTLIFLFLISALTVTAHGATLKIATLAPDGTSWMKAMRSAAKDINAETEGRVKLRFYPGGVMGNDKSVLRKIRIGQLHGGAITSGGLAGVYPDIQIYSLPFLFRSTKEVDYVRGHMDAGIISGLHKKGFVSFGIGEGGFAYLMSQTPFTTASALKSMKIWSPEGDQLSYNAFRSIGITPVPLSITDVLTGLQTGLIDTVGTTPIGAIALQWHSRVKHLADLPLSYIYATLVISEKALKKLADKDRDILQRSLATTFNQINTRNRNDNMSARSALQNQGIQFYRPDTSNKSDWNAAMKQVITDSKVQNRLSKTLIKEMQQHLIDFRKHGG